MKTHFAEVERGNESHPYDEWQEPLCGTYSEQVNNNWECVTCKKCLKRKNQYESEMKIAMEHNCKDMGDFVDFSKKKFYI